MERVKIAHDKPFSKEAKCKYLGRNLEEIIGTKIATKASDAHEVMSQMYKLGPDIVVLQHPVKYNKSSAEFKDKDLEKYMTNKEAKEDLKVQRNNSQQGRKQKREDNWHNNDSKNNIGQQCNTHKTTN